MRTVPPRASNFQMADAGSPGLRTQPSAEQLMQFVLQQYKRLPKNGKPQPHEYSVLAGFVVTGAASPAGPLPPAVVALGTGTKCLGGSARKAAGDVLNDSHAEVVARRALQRWMRAELQVALSGAPSCVFDTTAPPHGRQDGAGPSATGAGAGAALNPAPREGGPRTAAEQQQGAHLQQQAAAPAAQGLKLRLRPGVRVHMVVTYPPCGDACIVSHCTEQQPQSSGPEQQPAAQQPGHAAGQGAGPLQGATPAAVGSLAAQLTIACSSEPPTGAAAAAAVSGTLRTGAKRLRHSDGSDGWEGSEEWAVPQACDVESCPEPGPLRRKPGRGDATLSMSCSDKIARWCCLGLQGSLLSRLLEAPVYLASVVVAAPGNGAHPAAPALEAALHRAVAGRLAQMQARLPLPFAVHPPRTHVVTDAWPAVAELGLGLVAGAESARQGPTGTAVGWSACASQHWSKGWPADSGAAAMPQQLCEHEVTLGGSGRRAGLTRNAASSKSDLRPSLSSAKAAEWYLQLAKDHPELQLKVPSVDGGSIPYPALKRCAAPEYFAAWDCMRAPGMLFAGWLVKPSST